MELFELTPPEGAKKSRKRIGRGPGSGWGKTAGKGHKGQKSRAGGKVAVGFEGGQMPIYRRLPKRGFTSMQTKCAIIKLYDLNIFEDGTVVDIDALLKMGLVKNSPVGVKVLAEGDLDRKLTVKLQGFSKAAKDAIEAKGGTAEVV
ncbi:50S ribosomal protein L15 [Chrysiogenes arsenatis]|uniref:50S ribosomal protein L15 n=1 Tax=Chrysiogenes arsenatis TaxID=309797 RepID=UPI0003F620B8|nr:50S ribosomal protein L15 [Chrysiogenes arsenatis]